MTSHSQHFITLGAAFPETQGAVEKPLRHVRVHREKKRSLVDTVKHHFINFNFILQRRSWTRCAKTEIKSEPARGASTPRGAKTRSSFPGQSPAGPHSHGSNWSRAVRACQQVFCPPAQLLVRRPLGYQNFFNVL